MNEPRELVEYAVRIHVIPQGYVADAVRKVLKENEALWEAITEIDKTLQVEAAEYVPAIGEVFKRIDRLRLDGYLK